MMTTKKLIYFNLASLVLLLALTWWMYGFHQEEGFVQQLDGSYLAKNSDQFFYSALRSILFSFPLLALILGAILALFVQRANAYKVRLVRCFLWVLLIVYGLLLLMSLVKMVMAT